MASLEGRQRGATFLHRLSDRINAITEGTLFVSLLVLVGVTFLQVVFRFFFTALTWSEELSSFLLVWVSLLGMAVGFKRGSHIAVTFILEKLDSSIRKWLQLCIAVLGLIFFGIVVYFGWVMMNTEATQVTPAMGLSMRWIYLMYPITGAVTLLHIFDSIVAVFERGN